MNGLDVEAVLVAHEPEDGNIGGHYCLCSDHRLHEPWTAHVAAVLRVEIEAALGDAWDEGWGAGRLWTQGGPDTTNPYRPTLAATEGDRQ